MITLINKRILLTFLAWFQGADDDDDWSVDVSAEAVKARMEDLTSGAKGLTISDDLEKTEKERVDLFHSYVKQRRDQEMDAKLEKDIFGEAERLEVKDKAPLVVCELFFGANILAVVSSCECRLALCNCVVFNTFFCIISAEEVCSFAGSFHNWQPQSPKIAPRRNRVCHRSSVCCLAEDSACFEVLV